MALHECRVLPYGMCRELLDMTNSEVLKSMWYQCVDLKCIQFCPSMHS